MRHTSAIELKATFWAMDASTYHRSIGLSLLLYERVSTGRAPACVVTHPPRGVGSSDQPGPPVRPIDRRPRVMRSRRGVLRTARQPIRAAVPPHRVRAPAAQ